MNKKRSFHKPHSAHQSHYSSSTSGVSTPSPSQSQPIAHSASVDHDEVADLPINAPIAIILPAFGAFMIFLLAFIAVALA